MIYSFFCFQLLSKGSYLMPPANALLRIGENIKDSIIQSQPLDEKRAKMIPTFIQDFT